MSHRPWPLRLYAALTPLFVPSALRRSRERMRIAGIAPARARELSGYSTSARPQGRLLWCHAASVGESLSVLPLIGQLLEMRPDFSVVLTTGTPTAAQALRGRLPERCQHQFAPLDSPRPVRRFLQHWQPQAALWVESELWPVMLHETARADIPMALVNARLSARSLRRWHRARASFGALMEAFALILCADKSTLSALTELGIPPARLAQMPPLKRLAAAPVARAPIPERPPCPVWLAASTHSGEDEVILHAHKLMRETNPELRLILVPRHPERALSIAGLAREHGLDCHRRSLGQGPETAVCLADTVGEMEIWLGLSRFAFIGGSLTPDGGHNPYEALRAGVPVLVGPHRENFAADYDAILATAAGYEVQTARDLAAAGLRWLNQPEHYQQAVALALELGQPDPAALSEIARRLVTVLRL